jgi:hypothetical protein
MSGVAGVVSGGGATGGGVPLAAGGSGAFEVDERASVARGAFPLAVEEAGRAISMKGMMSVAGITKRDRCFAIAGGSAALNTTMVSRITTAT